VLKRKKGASDAAAAAPSAPPPPVSVGVLTIRVHRGYGLGFWLRKLNGFLKLYTEDQDHGVRHQTKTIPDDGAHGDPVWDASFEFPLTSNHKMLHVMAFHAFDEDCCEVIGRADIDLNALRYGELFRYGLYELLKGGDEGYASRGSIELHASLSRPKPSPLEGKSADRLQGNLKIDFLSGRNLSAEKPLTDGDITGYLSAWVNKAARSKSAGIKGGNGPSPAWNQSFTFELTGSDEENHLSVQVYDVNADDRSDIGRVIVDLKLLSYGTPFWYTILDNDDKVRGELQLQAAFTPAGAVAAPAAATPAAASAAAAP